MTKAIRTLSDHKVNPANDRIEVVVLDEPGPGGACHGYEVCVPDGRNTKISFQNGPIAEEGVNGVTHEALISILLDRLRAFQAGPYAGRENALALTKLEEAQMWLHSRTRARMARGVEGTHRL